MRTNLTSRSTAPTWVSNAARSPCSAGNPPRIDARGPALRPWRSKLYLEERRQPPKQTGATNRRAAIRQSASRELRRSSGSVHGRTVLQPPVSLAGPMAQEFPHPCQQTAWWSSLREGCRAQQLEWRTRTGVPQVLPMPRTLAPRSKSTVWRPE